MKEENKYAVQVFSRTNKKPTKSLKDAMGKIAKDFKTKVIDMKTSLVINFTDEFQARKCWLRTKNDAIFNRDAFGGFVVTGFQHYPERVYFCPEQPFSEY